VVPSIKPVWRIKLANPPLQAAKWPLSEPHILHDRNSRYQAANNVQARRREYGASTSRRPADDPSAPHDDHLLLGHVVHGVGNTADTITRLTTSGERHPVNPKRGMIVDQDRGCIERAGGAQRDVDIAGKDRCLKGERQAVGLCDGFIQVGVGVNAGDRPEDLFARQWPIMPRC